MTQEKTTDLILYQKYHMPSLQKLSLHGKTTSEIIDISELLGSISPKE